MVPLAGKTFRELVDLGRIWEDNQNYPAGVNGELAVVYEEDDESGYLREELIQVLEEMGCRFINDEPIENALRRPILMIPDKVWGIRTSATDHPGLCVSVHPEARTTIFIKGTDQQNLRALEDMKSMTVHPDTENGLKKPTSFKLVPRQIKLHKVRTYFPERILGKVDEVIFSTIIDKLQMATGKRR